MSYNSDLVRRIYQILNQTYSMELFVETYSMELFLDSVHNRPEQSRVFCSLLTLNLVGAQLCQLSPVDAHTVALKPVMGKYLDIIHDIVLWHFATCTSVNCLTCVLVMI